MKLNGEQTRQLHRALLSAFPDGASLQRLVKTVLEENLAAIARANKLADTAFDLIEWAEAHGKLEQLIEGAYRDNPGNPDLHQFVEKVSILPMVPINPNVFGKTIVLKNPTRQEISEQFRKREGLVVVRGLSSKGLRDHMTPIYREVLPSETKFLYTDLEIYSDEQLSNAEGYFKALAADVAASLSIDFNLNEHWKRRLGPQQNMINFVHDFLTATSSILLWRVHHVDRLVDTNFSDNAFSFFRVLYNEGWDRLIMVLCCYADPNTFIRNTRMSPFNVGVRLEFEGAI